MSIASPFKSPERFKDLKATLDEDDTVDHMVACLSLPEDLREPFAKTIPSMDMFASVDKELCKELVEEFYKTTKHTYLSSKVNRKFLASMLLLCAKYQAFGGSFRNKPTGQEMANYVMMYEAPSLLMGATPVAKVSADTEELKIPAIDPSKLSDSLKSWDGDMATWFAWKKKFLTKLRQHPEFQRVLLDENEAKKDAKRSSILYGILLEKTEGGAAHTLVESLPEDKQTGYEAYRKIMNTMEGAETRKRLEQVASKRLKDARLNPGTPFLEFQGNMENYLLLMDQIHDLQGIPIMLVPKRIEKILAGIHDPAYEQRIQLIEREIREGKNTTVAQVYSDLQSVETRLRILEDSDIPDGTTAIRRVEQLDPGKVTPKKEKEKGGTSMRVDTNFTLPQALYASSTTEQQCYWQKFLRAARDNNGNTASLRALEKPTATELEVFSKKRKQKKEYEKARKKQRKTKANGDNVNPYLPSLSDRPSLSIENLASGESTVPTSEKMMPAIRILMFKEPKSVVLPISGNPLAQRPNGRLAISPLRSSNPKEEEINMKARDFTYIPPPLTVISNVQIRQTNIVRWMRQRKLSVDPKGKSVGVTEDRNCLDIYGISRQHGGMQEVSDSSLTVSTGALAQRSVTTGQRTVSILDTGCDWSMVAQGWHVVHEYDELFHCQGAFFTGQSEVSCCLVDAITIFLFEDTISTQRFVRANRVLYLDDPAQLETLLDPIQLLAAGHTVDLTPKQFHAFNGDYGKQGMYIGEVFLPFSFDGKQLYFKHRLPTKQEMDTIPLELTSRRVSVYPLPYETKRGTSQRRLFEIIRRQKLSKATLKEWRANLAFIPEDIVAKTLEATSQLISSVEAEQRIVPRKHLVSRLLPLRHRRLREHFATDWFHVTTQSVRQYRGVQLYYGKKSKTLFPYCLKRKLHMVDSLRDVCREIGIPEVLIMDGDGAQNNPEVESVLREYLIRQHNSEPENQQQNLAERGGGILKQGIRRLHFETRFDIAYGVMRLPIIVTVSTTQPLGTLDGAVG